MELKDELESGSPPRIKKAAKKIAKEKLDAYEESLLCALKAIIDKPKSWEAQCEVIKAIGVVGSEQSLPYLKELAEREFSATTLYINLGFSICLLEDISNNKLDYTLSILGEPNDLLLSGFCAAIWYAGFTPGEAEMVEIMNAVVGRDQNEKGVLTPRCYIAAVAYSWPPELTRNFLEKCAESLSTVLVEVANDSLTGKKTRYTLI